VYKIIAILLERTMSWNGKVVVLSFFPIFIKRNKIP
jgi:hypothetical protein